MPDHTALDSAWQDWLDTNIQRGCDPEELVSILLQNGFSIVAIRKAMGPEFPAYSPIANNAS